MLDETLLNFAEASKYLPGRVAIATLHRWRLRGLRGVKLETCMVGGRRYTSQEALERFVAATTSAADGESAETISKPRTSAARQRSIERANKELEKAGI